MRVPDKKCIYIYIYIYICLKQADHPLRGKRFIRFVF